MWAGSHIEFRRPLLVGDSITKTSTIADISRKDGRSGPLVFVRVHHEISVAAGVAIVEDQDLVYREMPKSGEGPQSSKAAPDNEQFSRNVTPDPVLLFRYSALTFNSHRIHYDRPYAMSEEGYPGLVVHGPLIATLLMGEVTRAHPRVGVTTFEFRAVSPLFDTAPFTVCGRRDDAVVALWARGPGGQLAMSATATVSHDTQP
jgi:3-methylfumaryl-CoA hydratase